MRAHAIRQETIAEILRLQADGCGERNIARRLGIGRHFVTRIINPETIRRKQRREAEYRRGASHRVQRMGPPSPVIAERDLALSFNPTPNHVILGDPPPLRSALWGRR